MRKEWQPTLVLASTQPALSTATSPLHVRGPPLASYQAFLLSLYTHTHTHTCKPTNGASLRTSFSLTFVLLNSCGVHESKKLIRWTRKEAEMYIWSIYQMWWYLLTHFWEFSRVMKYLAIVDNVHWFVSLHDLEQVACRVSVQMWLQELIELVKEFITSHTQYNRPWGICWLSWKVKPVCSTGKAAVKSQYS